MAGDVRSNVLVYSAAAVAGADRRALQSELIRALADGPGVVVFEGLFRRRRRSSQQYVLRHYRRAALRQRRGRRPFRQVRRQRPLLERRAEVGAVCAAGTRRVLRQRHARRHLPGPAEPALSAHLTGECRQARWDAAGSASELSLGLPVCGPPGGLSCAPAPHVAGLDAAGRGRPLRLAGGQWSDMPLPYSQRFAGGYMAFNRPESVEFFAEHHVQLLLRNGDAVFFNPALYHGAGSNISADIRRISNLLQISSPFGRAIEALDHTAMVRTVYPSLRAVKAARLLCSGSRFRDHVGWRSAAWRVCRNGINSVGGAVRHRPSSRWWQRSGRL